MDVRWIFLFTLFCGIEFAVRAELSTSSCSLLRTATSVATMVPEFARLAMRYYSSSSSVHQHRAKRFLFQDNNAKNTGLRGTVLDQMVANAFKDVNYTKVAVLLFHNPESLAKLRKNFNADVIVRAMMQEIDYERLGQSLWYAAEAEFDLERFLHTIINITHIDLLHEEMVTNGTIPEWFIKSLHSDLNVHTVNQMFSQLKNFTYKLVGVLSSSERLDDYLFKMIQQQILTPMNTMIQRVKEQKPSTLDQLVEVILSNVNRVINVRDQSCCFEHSIFAPSF